MSSAANSGADPKGTDGCAFVNIPPTRSNTRPIVDGGKKFSPTRSLICGLFMPVIAFILIMVVIVQSRRAGEEAEREARQQAEIKSKSSIAVEQRGLPSRRRAVQETDEV